MFKWGVSQELIPAHILEALRTVDGLKRGRSDATEPEPVGPVPADYVDAIREHVPHSGVGHDRIAAAHRDAPR